MVKSWTGEAVTYAFLYLGEAEHPVRGRLKDPHVPPLQV
jgi:hypothetical protein